MEALAMKKTTLRKNRFPVQAPRLPDISSKRKLSGKVRRSRDNPNDANASLRAMLMRRLDDSGIAELLAATVGRPISPEAQAFYDHVDALKAGKATWDEFEKPVLSDAA
jgi:hypothetical protein